MGKTYQNKHFIVLELLEFQSGIPFWCDKLAGGYSLRHFHHA